MAQRPMRWFDASAIASCFDSRTVVFLHTGGLPAVFAYRDDLLPYLRPGREGTN
jgi:1-aminocyclopropane-1-carboxylate deaminase/D-cysteine desulfhydrase-like pyridoxal-dependent ACC family enzyme